EASFVGRVDAALSPRGVEVLNAGVISYCPIIYFRKDKHLLEDVGLRFDALVVYIDIGDIEDEVTYKLDADGNVRPRPARRVQEQGRGARQASFWRRWTADNCAGFIDCFPRFIDGAPSRQVLDRYFIPGDVHWNEEGHRLIADGFLEYYERNPLRR